MRRLISLLLTALLLLTLAGCRKADGVPSKPDEPVLPAPDGITLAELNVEFVAGSRDADELMKLKKELPPLLIGALADEDVTVGKVNVTFGASDEATAEAMTRGTVQVGFLPAETYLAHEDALCAVDLSLSPSTVVLGASASDYGQTLAEQATGGFSSGVSWSELEKAVWALPQDEDGLALRWLNAYLDRYYDGKNAAALPRTIRYAAGEVPEAHSYDLYVAELDEEIWKSNSPDFFQEVSYFSATVAAVSRADDILCSEEFLTAIGKAVSLLSEDKNSMLYSYDGVCYSMVDPDSSDALLSSWRLVYDYEHE